MARSRALPAQPLLFQPILKEKVWGGQRLRALGKPAPARARIGESWEIADLSSTDPGGGGGAAAHSVIASGPLEGRSLRDAIDLWGADLLGQASAAPEGGFPLLVKFLDAAENLSVQVHPSAAYAAAHPEAHLKTEAWFVMRADPGAVIYKGLARSASREALRAAAQDGSIVELLRAVPARPGDCHNLPSGIVHALGAGVMVAEVQTPSDTTFRLYDWGRTGRTLHIDQAVECAILDADNAPPARHDGAGRSGLVETDAFTIEHARLSAGQSLPPASAQRCCVWMVVEGAGALRAPDFEANMPAGATALIPAACAGAARFVAGMSGACVLESTPGARESQP